MNKHRYDRVGLVLCCKEDERIFIGDSIVLTVVSVGDEKVRIGIMAPEHLPVDREKVAISKGLIGGER